jgi:hypothetical protein
MQQARRYQIKGRTNMSLDDLRSAVGDAVKTTSAPRGGAASKALKGIGGPVAAASLAYAMTPDSAQAADGSAVSGQADGLTNAAVAGGAAYGANRLIAKLPSAVGGAIGAASSMMAPATIDGMTDYSDDELAQGRNWAARNLPESLQFGAVDEARQMAQVPEPSPMRQEQEPEGDFESQMAHLQEMLSSLGAAEEPEPVANAVASQRVSAMQPSFAPQMPTNRLMATR